MNLSLGNEIAVSTSYIRSNPAVPIYKENELFGVIYHLEVGYFKEKIENLKEYIIVDFKEYELCVEEKEALLLKAKEYCESKNLNDSSKYEMFLLDNEEAEGFVEKLFDNMKIIRGLTSKRG